MSDLDALIDALLATCDNGYAMTVDGITSTRGPHTRPMIEEIDDNYCARVGLQCSRPLTDAEQARWLRDGTW